MNAYARKLPVDNIDRDQLIAEHIEMARRIALRVARRVPNWILPDDLSAAAMIGLTEAADRYDDSRGEPFVAFAVKRIRGAVLDELRRGDIMPRRVRQAARKVGNTIRILENQLGRRPEDEEIAAEMGVQLKEYRESLKGLTHVQIVDLGPHLAKLGTDDVVTPESMAEKAELTERMHACLTRLPERDALLLSLYYIEDLNYVEVGEVLGVSESRVCQLHARAITRLRTEMMAQAEEQ